MKKLLIILLRIAVAFVLLFMMIPSCGMYQDMSTANIRYDAVSKAYPNLDLYPHPINETEIVAIDWQNMLVFLIKIGGRAPYTFIILDKARNSDYIKNVKAYEDKTRPTSH